MIGSVNMYKVGFGDAFLLIDRDKDEENFLVDFGGLAAKKKVFNTYSNGKQILGIDEQIREIRNTINTQFRDRKLSIVLTHFHEDHWKGLYGWSSHPKISAVYLPDIFGLPGIVINSILSTILDAVILKKQPKSIITFTLKDLLFDSINGLNPDSVHLLKRGDTFPLRAPKFEVLWPDVKKCSSIRDNNEQVIQFLNKHYINSDFDLKSALEACETYILSDFLARIKEKTPDRIDDYTSVLNHRQKHEKPFDYDTFIDNLQELVLLLQELTKKNRNLEKVCKDHLLNLESGGNEISLVFHTINEENDPVLNEKGILMTGDITNEKMREIILSQSAPLVRDYYRMIKAPHHGTHNDHFCELLPKCSHLCISHMEYGNYSEISAGYPYVFGTLMNASIHCTDQEDCEYRKHYNKCHRNCVTNTWPLYEIITL